MDNSIEKKTPYHIQAYNLIKNDILNHRILGGEKVNETTLSRNFKISRSPVREALRMLECDRLLVSSPSGLIVNPLPSRDIKELYQCRMMIESFAASLTAKKISDEDLTYLSSCIELAETAQKCGEIEDVLKYNTNFHELIVSLCGNNLLQNFHNINRNLIILSRSNEFFQRNNADYLEEHNSILQALRAHDSSLSEKRVRRHIQSDLDYYLKYINKKEF